LTFDDRMEELLLVLFTRAMAFVIAFNKTGYLSSLHPDKTQQKYKALTEAIIDVYDYLGILGHKED
jgi:hypothetical protein